MGKVLVFGSLNMDLNIQCERLPEKGETIAGNHFFTTPGGKGANQAVAAAKLGASTRLIGCIGNDVFGAELIDALTQYEVICDSVIESKNLPTGTAMIINCNDDNRIILNPGANHELTEEDIVKLITQYGTSEDVFVTQYECDLKAVQQSLVTAKSVGMYTIFNPAPANAIPSELYALIDLIVVNETECQFLTGIYPDSEENCKKAINRFRKFGARQIVITLGSRGSVYTMEDEIYSIPACNVPTVDTTAAGDTLIGGMAVGISRKWPMKECLIYATKAAALTVIKPGAQQSIPKEEEVNQYFKESEE